MRCQSSCGFVYCVGITIWLWLVDQLSLLHNSTILSCWQNVTTGAPAWPWIMRMMINAEWCTMQHGWDEVMVAMCWMCWYCRQTTSVDCCYTARLHEHVEAEVNDDFHLMPIVPCCCMIWIHAGNGIWFEYEWMTVGCCCCFRGSICMSLMYLPAKQLFNGMRFCQRVCWWAIYFGSRVEAMDGKATVMPPVCCILRMCVGIDHCNYILGLLSRPFLRNRYSRVRVSYDAMWVLLCTLHSAMDYRLFFIGLLRSILMWSIVRETATKWFDAVAGYATFEWWIVAMMILSFMIFNRRLLW